MKRILCFIMVLTMVFALTGCGSKEADTVTATVENEAVTEAVTETLTEAVTEPITEPVEKQLSGKVVVYCPSPEGLSDNIAAAFKEKTGVEVEMFQGTTGEILARLETEKANPVADVVIMASWADGLNMIESDQVMAYTPQNGKNINWVDDANKIYGYSASAIGVIYNTTIFPVLSADWAELGTDVAYKDQIVIPDPLKSGSCKDFLSGFVNVYGDAGQTIIDSWATNGVIIPGANKAALESVTTGEKGILIAGVDYNAYSSINKGEPLAIYYPKSGTVVNPRPAMILKTSKNIENAQAYMDFLLSEEAQTLICDAYLLPGIKGVTTDKRANVADVPALSLDWNWMGEHSQEIADQLINSVD